MGYWVYRQSTWDGPFTERLTPQPIGGTSYTDENPMSGLNVYAIRAVRLEETGSGTHMNLSQATFVAVNF